MFDFQQGGTILEKYLPILKNSSFFREKSDYDDFFIASKKDAENQLKNAKIFLSVVEDYLKTENHNLLANPQISRH